MKALKAYRIALSSLEDKTYQYQMVGDRHFFEAFDSEWIENGHFTAEVELDKSPTMVQVKLQLNGALHLICDRSLEAFEEPFSISEKLIFKFSDHSEDLGDNLYLVDRKAAELDLSQDIYDFIALQVPMKKLHPKFRTEADASEEDLFLYSTEKEDQDKPSEDIDPRWNALKNLKE